MMKLFGHKAAKLLPIALAIFSQWSMAITTTPILAQETDCLRWPRTLPPEGIEIPPQQLDAWRNRLAALDKLLASGKQSPYWPDVEVLTKACRLAIRFREFYQVKDFAKCDQLLSLAEKRAEWLRADLPDRREGLSGPLPGDEGQNRLQVRGFVSQVDGSVQPIGLVMPSEPTPPDQLLPLFVWLHGRGDKATDLHFLVERLNKAGEVAPAGAITLHPFGRHCVGYKSAGTTDVMEAIDFVCANYPVDPRKIVLIGFSMGGAGVWHIAARNADRFVAASPGAGFAETARYQNLTPDRYPPAYTQTLWSVYDVPGYTRNLFNLPVIAYSGENDKQIQAARVMEEAYQAEGRQLPHRIGPGMGHKYHPDVLKELLGQLTQIAEKGQPMQPEELHLQTRHLRVHQRRWISVEGMHIPYADTRVDAQHQGDTWRLTTKNVSRLRLDRPGNARLTIDDWAVPTGASGSSAVLLERDSSNRWRTVNGFAANIKRPGLSGPIDDAFFDSFMFVTPSGSSSHGERNAWVACEQAYAIERWTSLMRGAPRVVRDVDITASDMQNNHLVLWGDPESNSLIARALQRPIAPVVWNAREIRISDRAWSADRHMPVLIMPNPLAPDRYLVFNSGLTFRDAHDRTNSLQNPQLPDWAILDLQQPRSPQAAGGVIDAGFFDDRWQ